MVIRSLKDVRVFPVGNDYSHFRFKFTGRYDIQNGLQVGAFGGA